jgi:hypothetical protein
VLRGGGQGARVRRHAGGEDWSGQQARRDVSGDGIRGALTRQRRKLVWGQCEREGTDSRARPLCGFRQMGNGLG